MRQEVPTYELDQVLKGTHSQDVGEYLKDNQTHLYDKKKPFSIYVKDLLKEKDISLQQLFMQADIPERYGYKLLSEEKRTKKRDVILRMCFAGGFDLDETNRVLKLYGMSTLYAKIPRDAVLIVAMHEKIKDVYAINQLLINHQMEELESCGEQE